MTLNFMVVLASFCPFFAVYLLHAAIEMLLGWMCGGVSKLFFGVWLFGLIGVVYVMCGFCCFVYRYV